MKPPGRSGRTSDRPALSYDGCRDWARPPWGGARNRRGGSRGGGARTSPALGHPPLPKAARLRAWGEGSGRAPDCRPGKWGTPAPTDRFGEGDGPPAGAGAAAGREREDSARRRGCTAGPAPLGYGPGRTQLRVAPKAQPPGTTGRIRCGRRRSRMGMCNCYAIKSTTGFSLRTSPYAGRSRRPTPPVFSPFFRQRGGPCRMSGGHPLGTGAGPGGGWDAGWLPGPGAGEGDRPPGENWLAGVAGHWGSGGGRSR